MWGRDIFFSEVDEVPFSETIVDGKTEKDRMTGEVHFPGAMLYCFLTSVYGGVPIVTDVFPDYDHPELISCTGAIFAPVEYFFGS